MDDLIAQAREAQKWLSEVDEDTLYALSWTAREKCHEAAAILTALVERDEALIAAGDRLAGFAGHDDTCQIITHGVWSDPSPCTCGYTEAWRAWRDVTEGRK